MSARTYDLSAIAELEHGGFWIRVLASGTDGVITGVALIAVIAARQLAFGLPIAEVADVTRLREFSEGAVAHLMSAVYFVGFWTTAWHATPGKRVCGLTILASDGSELSIGRAMLRYVCLSISLAIFIGPLFILASRRKQALHDLMAGTIVVQRSALTKAAAGSAEAW